LFKEFTLNVVEDELALLVTQVKGTNMIRKRMLQMGITPGTQIEVLHSAPFDGPIEIVVRGVKLALRRDEAKNILVKRY